MSTDEPHQRAAYVDFIVHLIVLTERAEEVALSQREFELAVSRFPGHTMSQVKELDDPPERCRSFAAVHRFDTVQHLIGWLESEDRQRLIRKFKSRYGDEAQISYPNELAGFSAWFSPPGVSNPTRRHVATWKQSLVVLLALYPLVLLLGEYVPRCIPRAHPLTVKLAVATLAVAIMGFFLVPQLARLLRPWMEATRFWPQVLGAAALIGALTAFWAIMHFVVA